jgi:serine/threonine-protein kinase
MVNSRELIPKHTQIRDTYTIVDYLGQGAFGAVYKVRHKFLGIQALKIFHPGSIAPEQESGLFTEAFMLSKFTHENVVRVYDANTFEFNGNRYCYIAMEYVNGGTLAGYIERSVKLPLESALKIEKNICCGLALAHKMNPPVVHRDVKPQNVMLSVNNKEIIAKVSDFGLANHVDPVTRVITAAGTIAYLPPEGFWNYETPASDVFSAAIILYIMLTGVAPFKMPVGYHETAREEIKMAIQASRNKTPLPPSNYNKDIDKAIDSILLKALDPDPKKRYCDADAFLKVIDSYWSSKDSAIEEEIQAALNLGRQYTTLPQAIKFLEDIIAKQPVEKQNLLKGKYARVLNNWKKGMIM